MEAVDRASWLPEDDSAVAFEGPNNFSGPPDATLAASPTRIVQIQNGQYAITDRQNAGVAGPLSDLIGSSFHYITDPQVTWDPGSGRFYFSSFENRGNPGPDEVIAWGFSTTAAPNTAADWCRYESPFNYGSVAEPDRPTLGTTKDFVTFVSQRYTIPSESFQGVDLAWVSKPPAGTPCPAATSFKQGIKNLKDTQGGLLSHGVAVRQVDSGGTGWALGQVSTWDAIDLYKITRNATTGAAIIAAPKKLAIPAWSPPADAPQAGLQSDGTPARTIETKEYMTQAYAAYDPRLGHTAVWTAHGVAGGAGAAIRWYEINTPKHVLDQIGTISDPNLYIFDGSIAPDRLIRGSTKSFGSSMVLGFDTSSTTTDVRINMVSKIGANPTSPIVPIHASPGAYDDQNCHQPRPSCRWGDYSGASPDPGASTAGPQGQVWLTGQWNTLSTGGDGEDWRTWTWLARP